MKNNSWRFGIIGLFAVLIFFVSTESAFAAKQNVCTITINSANERQTFRKHLPAGDFNFIELTSYNESQKSFERAGGDWFERACEAGVQCDILMISGHFGGSFFGSTGFELHLDRMEENSCSRKCDGILKRPKEVFLFGCNTLAGKNEDRRTPQEYLQVLLDDQIPRAQAERIVEARYGALGDSFKDRMRRVFPGVKHIYGFSSVSPLGAVIQPHLDNYLRRVSDYKSHLTRVSQTTEANVALQESLSRFPLVQTSGIQANEPAMAHRAKICSAHDMEASFAQRTKSVLEMLRDANRLIYLPAVATFFRKYEFEIVADPSAQALLRAFKADRAILAELDSVSARLTSNPSLSIDLHHINYVLGRTTRAEFEQNAKRSLQPAIRKLNRESADLICSLVKEYDLHLKVTASDVDESKLSTSAALSAFGCMSSNDSNLTARLLEKFNYNHPDGNYLAAGFAAMLRNSGYAEHKVQLASAVIGNAPELLEGMGRAVIAANASAARTQDQQIWRILEMSQENQSIVFDFMEHAGFSDQLARALLRSLKYGEEDSAYLRLEVAAKLTAPNSPVWSEFNRAMSGLESGVRAIAAWQLAKLRPAPTATASWALNEIKQDPGYRAYYLNLLGKIQLSANDQHQILTEVAADPNSTLSGVYRWVLSRQKNLSIHPNDMDLMRGRRFRVVCEAPANTVDCKEILEQ